MAFQDIRLIGVNDHTVDLFEGQYRVPNGMSYNSYLILDEKIAVMDTVDVSFAAQWLHNLDQALDGRTPDFLVVQHMEPDHAGSITHFAQQYPDAVIISSAQAFGMMKQFFGTDYADRRRIVKEGDILSLGRHALHFIAAPMVHWPEVMMTYDSTDKILFSADGFGKFGALDSEEPNWVDEARRYYIGIVGKFGAPVQAVLKKAVELDIRAIYPLHGPTLTEDLGYYLGLYQTWSTYTPEEDGIVIAYTSVYGNTAKAALTLFDRLKEKGQKVVAYDLARCDVHSAIADAFRFSKLVLAAPTYNGDVFPFMRQFIDHLTVRNFSHRTVALIENGSWTPTAARVMRGMLTSSASGTTLIFATQTVTIRSSLQEDSLAQMEALAEELCR